ncbi:alanine racemase [Virgibacillus sp. SK37]|uniref:alanine racemase n=1 Tax=Virgibacillus sp. SK37 TaxID=403957 RepID=UPI0005956F79|nr:alanine racemase [Virgibacillus sp. SK37]
MQQTLVYHHPTIAEISMSAFRENICKLKKHAPQASMLAVIKTNAYGHGVVPMGVAAVASGAERLGVTTVEEGVLLREHGLLVPIHILSSIIPEQAAVSVAYDLTISISSIAIAKRLSDEAINQAKIATVHLKVDTGLHRFGVEPNQIISFCETTYHLPGLKWEGIYTHFSSADEGDWKQTEKEFSLFQKTVIQLEQSGYHFPFQHAGGSTITLERKDMHLDMVRPGVALFGYTPAIRQEKKLSLKPVMTLKSRLLQLREIPPGTPVGYSGSYVSSSVEKIGVVPIGHGDGYKRALSNKGEMLVRGKRAKIIGTISLDQTLINVTNIYGVEEGDQVVLLGEQGREKIGAREIAKWADSNIDEVLASLTERIPRKYTEN